MSIAVDIEKKLGAFSLRTYFTAGDEVVSLLGASGCGKSMTLKCIAGVERPDRGRIVVDGRTLFDSDAKIDLTPQQRHTGLLFQNYALFPNMTVIQNIKAGARREKDAQRREKLVGDIIDGFGLAKLVGHRPHQLSGGQQQRVALARILVSGPDILLLDEPFSALDSHLRFKLEREVRKVIGEFGKTVVLVSHNRDEVFRLSSKIAVMNDGEIEAFGTKSEVFANPGTKNAAMLTGCKNISRARPLSGSRVMAEEWGMRLETLRGASDYVGIRMHDIRAGEGVNSFDCRVVEEIENPFSFVIMLKPVSGEGAQPIGWEMEKPEWARLRSQFVKICLPPEKILHLKG
ncbi:MAG: ATP-binding cassette domain-containing protein [Clostridia bacterium]|nr:ATP-binding cassette domain-containing protein [Clostridia bacterium]